MLKRYIVLALFCSFVGTAMSQSNQEADLKAVFIYNFTRYVDWDEDNNDDFVIGVIGSSDVTSSLVQISKSNTVHNRRIVIRRFNKPEEINGCDILFIPRNAPYSLSIILNKTDKGILTISEEDGFAKQGTAFNFVVINDKLKFEANLKAIDAAGLKASSQLLKLAIIVD